MPMTKRAGVLFLASGLVVSAGCNRTRGLAVTSTPSDVVVARPTIREVTDYEEFTGHTDAILSVEIRARVTGYLLKKDFEDGQDVNEGDILYEIDDRPYQTALAGAESTAAQKEAHRGRLEADFKRASNLFERAAIGKQEFDLISSNYNEAQADLNAAKAQLESARLNMSFTKVRSPMTGQLSRTLVDPGNLVRQEVTLLNDIVSADKLYVYFDVNEEALKRVTELIATGSVGGKDGKEVPVEVGTSVDADASDEAMKALRELKAKGKPTSDAERRLVGEFPYKGLVNFAENKLDAATGTLRVRGIIDNPRPWILSPGLFIRVRLPIGGLHTAVLVPEDSVGSDQGKTYLYVVDASDKVEYRPVEVGALFSGPAGIKLRAIRQGLAQSDRFIQDADALRRVRPGAKVSPKLAPPLVNAQATDVKTTSL